MTLTYTDATHFKLDVRAKNPSIGYRVESTYTYQGQTLDYAVFRNWNTERNVPRTVQVTELSAHKLVTAEKWESVDTWYTTTLTYTR